MMLSKFRKFRLVVPLHPINRANQGAGRSRWACAYLSSVLLVTACGDDDGGEGDDSTSLTTASSSTPSSDSSATSSDDSTSLATSSEEQSSTSTSSDTSSIDPSVCAVLPALPLLVETKTGFLTSEDFAFDDQGAVVGVDLSGNVVRRFADGTTKLIAPSIPSESSGTHYLPNGDLIVATGTEGRILRVTPDGAVVVLASGLAYPNGIDVDRNGLIYIAEQSANRLRVLDPVSGELTTLAKDIYHPNGVALAPDEQTIFVGSFQGGVVYRVPNPPTRARVVKAEIFAATPGSPGVPEALLRCQDLGEGRNCFDTQGMAGRCTQVQGDWECVAIDTCAGRQAKDACVGAFGETGECVLQEGVLHCQPNGGCFGAGVGDPCVSWGSLPASCVEHEGAMKCVEKPCQGLAPGAACEANGGFKGVCEEIFAGMMNCNLQSFPCDSAEQGDACVDGFGFAGTCEVSVGEEGEEWRYCAALEGCDELKVGDLCLGPSDEGQPLGRCVAGSGETLTCDVSRQCDDKEVGDRCLQNLWSVGVCSEQDDGLICGTLPLPSASCEGVALGSACLDQGMAGICSEDGCWSPLTYAQAACEGLQANDICTLGEGDRVIPGRCHTGTIEEEERLSSPLLCDTAIDPTLACENLSEGGDCWRYEGANTLIIGVCQTTDAGLTCESKGSEGSGGLDGINVDACGNVYVSEYVHGIVWRIRADGSQVEEAAKLPSSWIPNMHWGSGQDPWRSDVLYVSDREHGRMFGLSVGLPGVPEVFP